MYRALDFAIAYVALGNLPQTFHVAQRGIA